MAKIRTKTLQITLTEAELSAIQTAANKAGMTASQFGAKLVLGVVLGTTIKDDTTLDVVKNFRRLFCDAMELSLLGKLTPQRFEGLVEKRGGR